MQQLLLKEALADSIGRVCYFYLFHFLLDNIHVYIDNISNQPTRHVKCVYSK